MLKLTEENYYSHEANLEYLSNSQIKVFADCEQMWYEQFITREYKPKKDKTPLIVGNYVGTSFESSEAHAEFIERNKDKIFKAALVSDLKKLLDKNKVEYRKSMSKAGLEVLLMNQEIDYSHLCEKKAEYILADQMILKAKSDAAFMNVMTGAHEQTFTANLFGHPWKVRLDVWDADGKMINDLKTCKDFSDGWIEVFDEENDKVVNRKVPFYEAWNYHRQLAIYRAIVFEETGIKSEFQTISAITKQEFPDIDILDFSSPEHLERFDIELSKVADQTEKIIAIKAGEEMPKPCQRKDCPVCRKNRKITKVTQARAFLEFHG